ncbi:MAG: 1-acyl-sn-glycerol-3-phosphate acyltransferase [Gammaproteobacteria bacterium]|nr:1-acyl-sn-glycerol-3-phosphate acyltransferase [Gammaproteobacteria bacterium]
MLPLPYPWRYAFIVAWCRFVRAWLRICCGIRYEIEGLENVPEQPCVILSRHESAWETITLPIHFRPQTWVLKKELLKLPFFGWTVATLKPIAIDRRARRNALRQILEQGRERLAEGIWLVVFPEGTRVPPSRPVSFQKGGAVLAHHAGVPVLPIALDSGDYWPRNSFIKRPGTIRVRIGPCIPTNGVEPQAACEQAERWVAQMMRELRPGV